MLRLSPSTVLATLALLGLATCDPCDPCNDPDGTTRVGKVVAAIDAGPEPPQVRSTLD